MNKIQQFLITLVLIASNEIAIAAPLNMFVSIAPQRFLVQKIVGTTAQIEVLVQPGQDPHTFEPNARVITKLANAQVYFAIGVPFEKAWMRRIKAVNPQMEIVNGGDEYHHEHNHEHGVDPHTWTNPALMKNASLQWLNYLIQHDADNKDLYLQNYAALSTDLDLLDTEIRTTLAPILRPCHFMVFHPAWGHFATAYDLIQIPVEQNGKPPGAKTFVKLVQEAKTLDLHTVFVQPQFDRKTVQTLAEAIDGQVEILDPLAEDYFGNLRQVAKQIARSCTK